MLHCRYDLLFLACIGMLSACSSIKTYPNNLDMNLVIKTETDSGTFFSSIKASLDIYEVNAECKLNYVGTVKLNQSKVEVGLKPEHMTYLSFRFNRSGFLSSSNSAISYDTLIKPRKHYQYDAQVNYKNDIYNVAMFEKHSASTRGRELTIRHLGQCKQL